MTAKVWDVKSGKCVRSFVGHSDYVRSVAFSPSDGGAYLATGSDDTTAKVWDVQSGKCVRSFVGHSDYVRSVAFSPSDGGAYLATGSDDTTAKVWDVQSGKCVRSFVGHSNWVYSVAFSPNGTYLATGTDDHTTKLWELVSTSVPDTGGDKEDSLAGLDAAAVVAKVAALGVEFADCAAAKLEGKAFSGDYVANLSPARLDAMLLDIGIDKLFHRDRITFELLGSSPPAQPSTEPSSKRARLSNDSLLQKHLGPACLM